MLTLIELLGEATLEEVKAKTRAGYEVGID